MSSAFAILPASTTVPLDAAGRGSASFTVTNQTGRPVRVRVAVVSDGDLPAPDAWLTPPPVAERDLATDGAQQFTVLVAVPERSPGGTYHFRLDAVSVELPDEEWARSPLVHFVVAEPEPEPKPEEPPAVVRKGYVESLVGCLIGAFAGGLAIAVPSRLLRLVADALNAEGLRNVFEAISLLGTPIAFWIGAAVGMVWYLKRKGFERPYETALPAGLILVPWAVVVGILAIVAANALPDFTGKDIVLLLVFAFLIAALPPLLGRAIFRFRTTGRL